MRNNITAEEVFTLKALGYQVFMSDNPHFQTYCFFSDGERIGYLQRDELGGGLSTSTVHIANRQTGTGFQIDKGAKLTREFLERAFIIAPSWASSSDVQSVKKYATLAQFLSTRSLCAK